MGSPAWQKCSSAQCQARDHQARSNGTLPLNMYRSSPLASPKEKVYLFPTKDQEETISAQEVQGEEKEQEGKEVSTKPQQEVEDEYDTDSENEHPVEEEDDDDSVTFIRAVTTRRGQAVRVKFLS